MDMKERLQELAENARMMCVLHILEKKVSLQQS